jgi:hypothetical protein
MAILFMPQSLFLRKCHWKFPLPNRLSRIVQGLAYVLAFEIRKCL